MELTPHDWMLAGIIGATALLWYAIGYSHPCWKRGSKLADYKLSIEAIPGATGQFKDATEAPKQERFLHIAQLAQQLYIHDGFNAQDSFRAAGDWYAELDKRIALEGK